MRSILCTVMKSMHLRLAAASLLLFAMLHGTLGAASFDFNPKISYFVCPGSDDDTWLTQQGIASTKPNGYNLAGSGIYPGQVVRIYTTGDVDHGADPNQTNQTFQASVVFTNNNNDLGGRINRSTRFAGISPLPVVSLGGTNPYSYSTPPFNRSGDPLEINVDNDFLIGSGVSNATLVRVPAGAGYLRCSVTELSQQIVSPSPVSSIPTRLWPVVFGDNTDSNGNAKIVVEPIGNNPATGELDVPRFYFLSENGLAHQDYLARETDGGRNIMIVRDQQTAYPCKVRISTHAVTSEGPFNIQYHAAGGGADYSDIDTVLSFAANETLKNFWLPITNDTTYEPDNQRFILRMETMPNDNPNEAIVHNAIHNGGREVSVYIVSDDPKPTARFLSGFYGRRTLSESGADVTQTANEASGTEQVVIPVELDRPADIDIAVDLQVDTYDQSLTAQHGDPGAPMDYTWSNDPGTEWASDGHGPWSGYYWMRDRNGVAWQDAYVNMCVARIPAGGPTRVDLKLTINQDDIHEFLPANGSSPRQDERIAIRIKDGGYSTAGYPNRHWITILDDDPVPDVYFSNGTSDQSGGFATSSHTEPPATGESLRVNVPIQLSGKTKYPVTVWFSDDPSEIALAGGGIAAGSGSDYSYPVQPGSNFVTIPAGTTAGSIPVDIKGDNVHEGPEKVVMHLGSSADQATYNRDWKPATSGGKSGRHVLVIGDEDPLPAVSFALRNAADTSRTEPTNGTGSQNRAIRVSLTPVSAFDLSIPLSYAGNAARDSDFTAPNSVLIPANATSVTFDVTILDDALIEFDEVIWVGIGLGYSGFTPGNPSSVTMTIVDNDGGSHADQLLPRAAMPRPTGDGVIAMQLENLFPVAVWRIRGEPLWRMADNPNTPGREGAASGLAPGFHEIEFRGFDGYVSPSPMIVQVSSGQIWTPPANSRPYYIQVDTNPPGTSLTVNLTVNLTGVSGGWKLDGETAWRASGTTITGFPRGVYRVFYQPVTGCALPAESVLSFSSSPVKTVSKTYVAEAVSSAWHIGSLADSYINDSPAESTVFVGRITSSAGYASGTAAQVNTVLTCAHVLFDDATLSFATHVRWHHQAQKDFYQPAATTASDYTGTLNAAGARTYTSGLVPRGWLVLGGYAAKRLEYLQAGGAPGFATVESQNLDVAAAYFGQPVARGGKVGVLIRQTGDAPGRWLQAGTPSAPVNKRLIGYPYENVPHDEIGRVFRRTYSPASGNYDLITVLHAGDAVFNSYNIVAGGGMSGAPVMLERSPGTWSVCAIYLGSNRGSNFGVMREIGEDVGDLITQAEARAGDGNTTGGGSYYVSTQTVDDFDLNKGRVAFRSNVIGASWKILGGQSYKACTVGTRQGTTLDVPPEQQVPVEFGELPNWRKPDILMVSAPPGDELEYQAQYLAINYQAIQSQLAGLGASPALQAPLADYDGDGVGNLLEWAFNLDPARRDAATLIPVTGTRGLPCITMAGTGASRRLHVELVRLRAGVNPGLQYGVEFASALAPDSWLADGIVLAVGQIDDNWERVVVEDSREGRSARFARVKVIQN